MQVFCLALRQEEPRVRAPVPVGCYSLLQDQGRYLPYTLRVHVAHTGRQGYQGGCPEVTENSSPPSPLEH